ncbi:unnamed protein product [Leptidea sinapis]|uniref:Uncharacterized protein n=1 Tax=Leptidea sinapis TaxID=189913 RepID=A0A5E4R1M9_9NEOP|nr:unnamed protein product [Leptidea sinapis]
MDSRSKKDSSSSSIRLTMETEHLRFTEERDQREKIQSLCNDLQSQIEILKQQLNINLNAPLKTLEQLNEEVEKFVKLIQHTAWDNTPNLIKKTKTNSYPIEIRELIAGKRRQRNIWHQSRYYILYQ